MAIRQAQRNRTRQAILNAAMELIDNGEDVTVDAVVDASSISRATVYRYFESASDITWHVMSDRGVAPVNEVMAAVPDEPEARVLAAERIVNDYLFGDPDGVRRFEVSAITRRLDGTAQPTDRPARRLMYIDGALDGHLDGLDDDAVMRLRSGLALAIGSEAVIALQDTCRLSVENAREVTRWVALALLRQARAEAGLDRDEA